jgi:hypothetical protein
LWLDEKTEINNKKVEKSMLNLKKTAVAVLAFGSSAVFAGTMGPVCSAVNVTVPCERTGWDVGIYALYLQPSYSDNVAYIGVSGNEATRSVNYVENDPDWGWGFKLEGSYHFGTGTDLNLNWYHLNDNSTTRTFAGPFAFFDITDMARERFTVDPKWDAVNLEFGQHVDFGEFKNIRFHGGVQYARIETGLSAYASTPGTADFVSAASTAKFTGFGPRIGADMSYDLGNGFAIYGNGATAILAGTSKNNAQVSSNQLQTIYFNASRNAIVPELEAKLGLTYTYAMAQGDLTLDAGYMWLNYFHSQQTLQLFGVAPAESDFGVQGPYIGLKWMGTVV